MKLYGFSRRKRGIGIADAGAPSIGGPYRCYRCRYPHPEVNFEPCPRCGFDGPDTRWWWSRFVDSVRSLMPPR
jgi:hypothetical protein